MLSVSLFVFLCHKYNQYGELPYKALGLLSTAPTL